MRFGGDELDAAQAKVREADRAAFDRLPLARQKILTIEEAVRRKSMSDLALFLRFYAWPALNQGSPYMHNWHVDAICEHLEAIHNGEIKNLIINMPFRMLKSTIVSHAFPVWEWLTKPSLSFLTASYARDVAMRDAVDARRIIESELFQRHYGDIFQLVDDQNVKTRYENTKNGKRTITSTDSAGTGFGGNRVVVDDPLSALEADSDTKRLKSIEWFKGTASTRLNDARSDAIIVVHQRLHKMDLTGHILQNEPKDEWHRLILPMRYDAVVVDMGRSLTIDPRKEPGELLFAERLPEKIILEQASRLGKYHTAAQHQQNPDSREGQIFPRKYWKYYNPTVPRSYEVIVLSVDCAFKDTDGSDLVAVQAWGVVGPDKYLLSRINEHLGFKATADAVRAMAAQYPHYHALLIEDKANGSAVIETMSLLLEAVIPIEPEGGKLARAFAVQPEHEAGNLYVPDPEFAPWVNEYLSQFDNFPGDAHDDEVDSTTQFLNWWRSSKSNSTVFLMGSVQSGYISQFQ